MLPRKKMLSAFSLGALVLLVQACAVGTTTESFRDDLLLTKFAEWHLGFTTNVAQRDRDLALGVDPRWGLSELRFQQIWVDRTDGYWLYYETSQPDVRPDRNQIWRLYRNQVGDLKVDAYFFIDIEKGLAFWGKGQQSDLFDTITMADLTTREGCNGTYAWRSEYKRFVGGNPHGECFTIGKSYLFQHVEIYEAQDGTLVRNDWHSFYDEEGVAKPGRGFKLGLHGPTSHIYAERYPLK